MRKTDIYINGRPVKLDLKGIFHVELASGERLSSPSLQALNVKVARTAKFDSFKGLDVNSYTGVAVPVTIVGIAKSKGRFGQSQFKTADGGNRFTIVLDTPVNRATIAKMKKLSAKAKAAREESEQLNRTLTRRSPRDQITPKQE